LVGLKIIQTAVKGNLMMKLRKMIKIKKNKKDKKKKKHMLDYSHE
jgi:hypothetical protein